jgi:hypothetical protein
MMRLEIKKVVPADRRQRSAGERGLIARRIKRAPLEDDAPSRYFRVGASQFINFSKVSKIAQRRDKRWLHDFFYHRPT